MSDHSTHLMRLTPIALSTLTVLALQDAQNTAQAATLPKPDLPDVEQKTPEVAAESVEVAAEVAIAPPETVTPAPMAMAQPSSAIAPAAAIPQPEKMPSPVAQRLAPQPASSVAPDTSADLQISQANTANELYVQPVAAAITYGDPITIAEGDPLNEYRIGSYHMRTDRNVRRETPVYVQQTPDQYMAEIRSCMAARPELYRLREVDGERVLVPVLFDGRLGTLVNDADGRPICPSVRDRAQASTQNSITIPVQGPNEAMVMPSNNPL